MIDRQLRRWLGRWFDDDNDDDNDDDDDDDDDELCFCGMINRQKMLDLVSSWHFCQKFSPSQISDTSRVGLVPT